MNSERAHQTMLARHTVMMNHKMTPGGRPGSMNKYPVRDTQKIKPLAEQSVLGFLRDTYYNLKFKARSGVTTPKQIAMSMEPTL